MFETDTYLGTYSLQGFGNFLSFCVQSLLTGWNPSLSFLQRVKAVLYYPEGGLDGSCYTCHVLLNTV